MFGGGFTWSGVPFGRYILSETVLPQGYGVYLIPGFPFDQGLNGYIVEIGEAAPHLTVAVYNFLPTLS